MNYYYTKNSNKSKFQLFSKFLHNKVASNLKFDEIVDLVQKFSHITLDLNNCCAKNTCTCSDYFKIYICVHFICVASSLGKAKIPDQFKDQDIHQKIKRGRKPNASKALSKQPQATPI